MSKVFRNLKPMRLLFSQFDLFKLPFPLIIYANIHQISKPPFFLLYFRLTDHQDLLLLYMCNLKLMQYYVLNQVFNLPLNDSLIFKAQFIKVFKLMFFFHYYDFPIQLDYFYPVYLNSLLLQVFNSTDFPLFQFFILFFSNAFIK